MSLLRPSLQRRLRAAILVTTVVFAVWAGAIGRALADDARESSIAKTVSRLDAIEKAIDLGEARTAAGDLRAVIAEARAELDPIAEDIARAEADVKALGPAPKENEPPEPAELASERAALTGKLSTLLAQRTRLSAAIEQANGLLTQVLRRRLETFYASLARQETPLISPRLWAAVAADWRQFSRGIESAFASWRAAESADRGTPLNFALVAAAAGLSLLLFGPAYRAARRLVIDPLEKREPTRRRRLAAAGARVFARFGPGVIAGFAVIATARATGVLPGGAAPVAEAFWASMLALLMAQGFLSGLFAPAAPAWRLTQIGESRARIVSILTLGILATFGAALVVKAAVADAPSLRAAAMGVCAALIGALVILLSLQGRSAPRTNASSEDRWTIVRRVARIVGVTIIAAAVAGYVRFADFAATRLCYGALLVAVFWSLRALLNEIAVFADARLRRRTADASQPDAAEHGDPRVTQYWTGVTIDVALFLLAIPAALALAGWTFEGVRDITLRAFTGVRIGGVVISIGDVLAALGAFAGLLAATRLLQGALQRGPLAHSRIDRGVQDSLITLLGYAGLLVAIVTGVSILGVDLSNLALIAGALSVGVGLGLQGVVNNFVSGLILLFERPIKVGDWIVTQSGQGIVRKISVRSTEIETFEKSSIIVPNSELISAAVTNYTHRNSLGRVTVPVSVSYAAEPQRVQEILLDCAHRNPLFLIDPAPFVVWKNFGAAGLEFEVGGFLADIGKGVEARNALRQAIFDAFRKEGVPFPRQDVHLHYPDAAASGAASG